MRGMEQLHLGGPQLRERAPLASYEPVKTSARPNAEVDNDEVRARLPVLAVLFVVVMAFVLVSARAGSIAMGVGIVIPVARHLYVFRQ